MHGARRVVLRALLTGVAFGLTVLVFMIAFDRRGIGAEDLLVTACIAFSTPFVVGPAAVIELLAEKRPPSIRRDLVASVLAFVAGIPLIALAALEGGYVHEMVTSHDMTRALRAIGSVAHDLGREPRLWGLIVTVALPFAPVTFGRLEKLWAPIETAFSLGAGIVIGVGYIAVTREKGEVAVLFAGTALALSLGMRIGDDLAAAIERRLARSDE